MGTEPKPIPNVPASGLCAGTKEFAFNPMAAEFCPWGSAQEFWFNPSATFINLENQNSPMLLNPMAVEFVSYGLPANMC